MGNNNNNNVRLFFNVQQVGEVTDSFSSTCQSCYNPGNKCDHCVCAPLAPLLFLFFYPAPWIRDGFP